MKRPRLRASMAGSTGCDMSDSLSTALKAWIERERVLHHERWFQIFLYDRSHPYHRGRRRLRRPTPLRTRRFFSRLIAPFTVFALIGFFVICSNTVQMNPV